MRNTSLNEPAVTENGADYYQNYPPQLNYTIGCTVSCRVSKQQQKHTHTHIKTLTLPKQSRTFSAKKWSRAWKQNECRVCLLLLLLLLFFIQLLSLSGNSGRLTWVRLQQPQEQRYLYPFLHVHAGSFRVFVTHRTLTWTTISFLCVRIHTGGWAH